MRFNRFGFSDKNGKNLFVSFITKKGFLLLALRTSLRFKYFKELPNAPWKSRLYIGPLEIEMTRT